MAFKLIFDNDYCNDTVWNQHASVKKHWGEKLNFHPLQCTQWLWQLLNSKKIIIILTGNVLIYTSVIATTWMAEHI